MERKIDSLIKKNLDKTSLFILSMEVKDKEESTETRTIKLEGHNTSKYEVEPFYKTIYPINIK